jgi:RimJ/RimL family protein N-acetyltransferase
LLEGKNVNLRILEREDLPLFTEWVNDPEVFGEFNPLRQMLREDVERMLNNPHEFKPFIVEKKDGSKIGFIAHFYVLHPAGRLLEVGYSLIPSERGKGHCTEALKIMIDYLFLSKDANRIQALTDPRNLASQNVLEKVGFKREGVLRKTIFARGDWRDAYVFSIIKEEWTGPKILTK